MYSITAVRAANEASFLIRSGAQAARTGSIREPFGDPVLVGVTKPGTHQLTIVEFVIHDPSTCSAASHVLVEPAVKPNESCG